jgi:hypothetical protein
MPSGHAAPTKVGLRKLATAAGISIVDERRTDDGTDPDVIEVTCRGEMLLPTGQRITATGIKRIDLNAQTWASEAHKGKYRSFFLEHVASRAQNRAIRALLSVRGSYPSQVYSRPFAVVSYAPNMNHPEIRARYLDSVAPVAAQLYGSTKAGAKQIGPGAAAIEAPTAPEEDPAPATPPTLPGEKLAAAAGSDELAPAEAFAQLREIFTGWDGRLVGAGIHVLFDDENGPQEPNRLSAGQVEAIVLVHESLGHEKFETHWRSLVDASTKAAAA